LITLLKRRMARVRGATRGEILRAAQKDATYLEAVEGKVSSLVVNLLGPTLWARWQKWLGPATSCLYYSLTTLRCCQTLGEEYTEVVQVNRKQLTLPSSLSRLALVIVHSLGPAILASALRRLEKKLEDPDLEISPAARRTLLKVLPFLQSVASGLQKLHTCLFYLQGSYYHLAKRLLGIEYVKRVEEDEDESGGAEKNTGPVFRLLGGVAALHLILSALQTLRKPPSSSSSSTSVPLSSSADERRTLGHRCPLCLDALGTCGVTTATPCGHLACWTCLLEGLKATGECVVCRRPVEPHTVIPCRNYSCVT